MKKILLVSNSSWYLYNFRLSLIKDLKIKGYDLKIVCPKDNLSNELKNSGLEVINWKLSRESINPFLELLSIINLFNIYKKEKPFLVHHFTIKSCIYGTIAAKLSKVSKIINAITGLGHVFVSTKKRTKLLRFFLNPIYKFVFLEKRAKVIFQNQDDQIKFLKMGFTTFGKSKIIKGSGVDTQFFKPSIDNAGIFSSPIILLFPSRIIKEKGFYETISAFNIIREEGHKIELFIAGEIDKGNRSTYTKKELEILIQSDDIHFLGHVKNMHKLYSNADIVILPSWREGLSKTLIEASAMERPIITTNVPGCRDIVENGENGLLVPKKNIEALALAIKFMILNPSLAREFGKRSRLKVIREFETIKINKETIEEYESSQFLKN